MTSEELLENRKNYTPKERVDFARNINRPNVKQYISAMFTDFYELHGDRCYGDDKAIIGGLAMFDGIPVTVVGHVKGHTLNDNVKCNFGMPNPEGYRKALRLFRQAEKFNRPVITFIDTPGAYPGMEAEQRGQGEAIAKNLFEMSGLSVPVIAVIIGEGGSGGALALGVADKVLMLENSVYSVLSPEGFASILWKDSSKADKACDVMRLTSYDLYKFRVCDRIVEEAPDGAHTEPMRTIASVSSAVREELAELMKLKKNELLKRRYEKYRSIGALQLK